MKIIISPSKSKNIKYDQNLKTEQLIFEKEHLFLKNIVTNLPLEELIQKLKIPKNKKYFSNTKGHAILSYMGEQFKALDIETLAKDELQYLEDKLLIYSAYYGIVKPLNIIEDYYLDNQSKLLEKKSLLLYWHNLIENYLGSEEIVNLASQEFSKKLKADITIDFYNKQTNTKVRSVQAKQLRGKLVREIAKQKIPTIKQLENYILAKYETKYENKKLIIYV